MSHVVSYYPFRSVYYYDLERELLYGFKSITVEERKDGLILHAYFMKDVYDYELNNDGITIKCAPVYQDMCFKINVLVDGKDAMLIEKPSSVYTGSHISPLLIVETNETNETKPAFYDLFSTYFVCFKAEAILFYDAHHVSVSQFTIPRYETLKQLPALEMLLPEYVYNFVLHNHRLLFKKASAYQKEEG